MIDWNQDEFMENCKKAGTDFLSPDFKPLIIDFPEPIFDPYGIDHPAWNDKETKYECWIETVPYKILCSIRIPNEHPFYKNESPKMDWKKLGLMKIFGSSIPKSIIDEIYEDSVGRCYNKSEENCVWLDDNYETDQWRIIFYIPLKVAPLTNEKFEKAKVKIKDKCSKLANYLKQMELKQKGNER